MAELNKSKIRNMKKLLIVSVGLLLSKISNAQYIQDYSQNTLVSNELEIQSLFSGVSPTGNLFSFYLENQNFKVQVLDVDGNKLLDPNGVILENDLDLNNGFSGIAHESQIVFDASGNVIIAHEHQDGIKVKKISASGVVLGSTTLTSGYMPKIEKLSETDILVGYYNDDQSDMNSETSSLKRLHLSGSIYETVWSKTIDYEIENIKLNTNQDVYLVSYDVLPSPPYVYVKANLVNQDNGDLIWNNWISCSSKTAFGLYSERLSTAIDDANNLYVVKSYIDGFSHNAYAQKIDSSGAVLWGTNGVWLAEGISNLTIATQVYCFYDDASDQLNVFINGDNNDNALQIYSSRVMSDMSGVAVESLLLVPNFEDAYLFGVQKCNDDFILAYVSKTNNKIYAKKVDNAGQNLWPEASLVLNSTEEPKLALQNFNINKAIDEQLVVTFLDTRAGIVKGYAQNLTCEGYSDASLKEDELVLFNVYPNPTDNKITIQSNSSSRLKDVQIRNLLGQVIYQNSNLNSNSVEIAIEGEEGIYFVKIETSDDKTNTYKVLKK